MAIERTAVGTVGGYEVAVSTGWDVPGYTFGLRRDGHPLGHGTAVHFYPTFDEAREHGIAAAKRRSRNDARRAV